MRKIEKAEQAEADYKRALKRKSAKKAEEYRKEMARRRRILRSENEGIRNMGMLEDWKNSSNFRLIDEMDRMQTAYDASMGQGASLPDGIGGGAAMGSGALMDAGIVAVETIVF